VSHARTAGHTSKMRRAAPEIRHTVRVACCIRSPEARDVAAAAVRRCGGENVVISATGLWNALRDHGPWAALIHDLGPWNGSGTAQIMRAREEYPHLPILLYVPVLDGVADSLVRCGALACLRAELQQRENGAELERVQPLLAALLAERPRVRVLELLRLVIPMAPIRVWQFADLALSRLSAGDDSGGLHVAALARELGASERTLERAWHQAAVPAPKELLGWLALLLVGVHADTAGIASAQAARQLRIDSRHLYRLRHRLLGGEWRSDGPDGRHEYNVVLLAFTLRCRELRVARYEGRSRVAIA